MSDPASATARALAIPELLMEVASHLELGTLYEATLVSRQWAAISVHQLYRHPQRCVVVGARQSRPERARSLARTLASRPDLAGLVRELCFRVDDWEPYQPATPTETQVQSAILSLCPNLKSLDLEAGVGDTARSMEQLIGSAASCSQQLTHLWIKDPSGFDSIAPWLASFDQLTHLHLKFPSYDGADASGWVKLKFELRSLKFAYWYIDENDDEPYLSTFQWLTASSRASLRHLDIEGYPNGIIGDILNWGDQLHTLRVGVLQWISRERMMDTLRLANLHSLCTLIVAVEPAVREDGYPDMYEYGEFLERITEAAVDVNEVLEKMVVAVEEA